MVDGPEKEIVTLWRPAGQAERDSIAASGWRTWPPAAEPSFRAALDRRYAAEIAREITVPREGVGYVMEFDLPNVFLDRYDLHQVDAGAAREYRIPDEDLADLNASIVGAIREIADYRGPVPDAEFEAASLHLGVELPRAWRAYLQSRSWFRRGWLTDTCFLWLYPPGESVELTQAWEPSTARHPGIAIIGGDRAREQPALDLRHASRRL